VSFYLVEPRKDATQNDLAVMAARVFEATIVLEDNVVDKFVDKFSFPESSHHTKKRTHSARLALDKEPALPGEQVAARVSKSADGSWILGNVLDYDPRSQTYAVQDEDDVSRVVTLLYSNVKRLEDSAAHLRRGDAVYAVFPETTSFYRAVVVKNPKTPLNPTGAWDVVVRFEDDEDETGKIPARRVPARFVLERTVVEGDDESEDDF
jgi:hypothetical protein